MSLLKRFAGKLPISCQTELKRFYFRQRINANRFAADEPEYDLLDEFIGRGDWVIDIGANVGHYTKRFSDIVGPSGRVLAFEPVPETFALLASNVRHFRFTNVSLINAAVSSKMAISGMSVPTHATGLADYYQARLSQGSDAEFSVLTMVLDSLQMPHRIALIKIDVEGHEELAVSGMEKLITEDKPTLIIETASDAMIDSFRSMGYRDKTLPESPNTLFVYSQSSSDTATNSTS